MKKLELLSPAGDMEQLNMSILYGADAVYLAGTSFGMRSFAGNFSPEALPEGGEIRPRPWCPCPRYREYHAEK